MKRRSSSAEFKRESTQIIVDQCYTVAEAAKAMDIGLSTMMRWVKQRREGGWLGQLPAPKAQI